MSGQYTAKKKRKVRLLKACTSKPVNSVGNGKPKSEIVEITQAGCRVFTMPQPEFQALLKDGLLEQSKQGWMISASGKMHLRRLLSEVDEFQSQHRLAGEKQINRDGQVTRCQTNEGESPLSRLRFRTRSKGVPYIDEACFQAGERLRQDFTRGNLMQQITSNWSAAICEGGRSSARNGIEDLSDAAMSARIRTEKALAAVGPEFSGVLVDICCFLKGLGLVERERQWPSRSAKLMLRAGLSILARHYGFEGNGRGFSPSRHWGEGNYRPEVFTDNTQQ